LFKGQWKYLSTRGNVYAGRNTRDPVIILQKMAPNKGITRRFKDYTLSHCHILLVNQTGTHAICGFVRGGKYYIYDSNGDDAYEYDWSSPRVYKVLAKYYQIVYKAKGEIKIHITACYVKDPVFIYKNWIKQYNKNMSQSNIRQVNNTINKRKNALAPVSSNSRNNRNN
jgi:hypothetical protein